MKKTLISLALLSMCGLAHAADYNPFSPKPIVDAAPVEIITIPSPGTSTAPEAPKADHDSANLDEELKSLLKKLEQSDQGPKSDEVEFVATANCVDIYYHNDTKTYEERLAKTCIKKATKDKIKKEMKSLEEKSKNERGQHDQKN